TIDYQPSSSDLLIGAARYLFGFGRYFKGQIDEVRVWNKALSASELAASIDRPVTGSESNLAVSYNFNEAAGTSVLDQTANHNNGTLTGTTPPIFVPSTAPIYTRTAPAFGANLIFNGDAESGLSAPTGVELEYIPGWITTSAFTTVPYGLSGFAQATDPGPANRGVNFFGGGQNTALSTA